jgi:hypothetical protein
MSEAMGLSKMIDRYVDALYSISDSLDEFIVKNTLREAIENFGRLSYILPNEYESNIDIATLSAIAFLEKRISKELPHDQFRALYNSVAEILRMADDLKKKLSPANYQRLSKLSKTHRIYTQLSISEV